MPVVLTNPQFPYQIGSSPTTQAFSVQSNFRSMIGEVCQWNPNVDPENAGRMLNNRYRQILDRRNWYGLKVKGIAAVAPYVQTGSVTVTNLRQTVQGTGTNWTTAVIGLQFRIGFPYEFQTIIGVDTVNQVLTLDTPFQGQSGSSSYQIVNAYLTFGANIKRLSWAKNQLFGWPIEVNVPVEVINARDTWRQQLGWVIVFATRSPTPDGQFQVEAWPTPYTTPQQMPFEAWTQPPNMDLDGDSPVAWIRSDLLVDGAIADALLFRPKQNPYYSEASCLQISGERSGKFNTMVLEAENADEGLNQQAVTWDYSEDEKGYGSLWAQTHA